MLDTLLQIGKTLRKSGRLRHHLYIIPTPISDKKTEITYFSIPVDEKFNFELDKINQIHDEDFIRKELFYLKYKSSNSDSSVKYMWGDIFYGVIKDKELGYYRMEIPERNKKSSFGRGLEDAEIFKGTKIEKFRNSFEANQQDIEDFLKENSDGKYCYLHFDFQGEYKHWYQFEEELDAMNGKFLDEFLGKQNDKFVLRKSLYKTIASPEKNLPFPQFSADSMYKAKTFDSSDEVMDLLYAITYSTKDTIRERDIKIIVLPKGENLEADQIEEFFEGDKSEKKANTSKVAKQDIAEEKLSNRNKETSTDDFLDSLIPQALFEIGENIESFDFIFSKAGGVSSPDVDMIELSGLRKSHLRKIGEVIAKIRLEIQAEREKQIKSKKELFPFDVRRSFLNILGDVTKDKKKYQSHLLKVLPQIYAGTYKRDGILLPAFIEKTEFNIRNENTNFNLLKFDYEFLTRLQQKGIEKMDEMKNSDSYKVGKLLGELAQPVSWEIKSFEKNYVGLLSRRISDTLGLISFSNFINEKLAIHERTYPSLKDKFGELAELLGNIGKNDYHKDYCAFGFFEGYFKKFEKPEKQTDTADIQTN